MPKTDGKIEYFDTILCTEEVKEKLLCSAKDTGLNLVGMAIMTASDDMFKDMKTKEGKPVKMLLINSTKFLPGKFKPFDLRFVRPDMVVTWKQSYTEAEITSMRCELVDLNRRLFILGHGDGTDRIRFGNLRKCLALLGFWYCGGDVFEETDGTNVL